MKDVTQAYIDKEESNERRPAELYHVWRNGGENWYYTDGDIDIPYDGNTYEAATLSRGSVRYNSQLEAQTLSISASYLQDATIGFLSINPALIYCSLLAQRQLSILLAFLF